MSETNSVSPSGDRAQPRGCEKLLTPEPCEPMVRIEMPSSMRTTCCNHTRKTMSCQCCKHLGRAQHAQREIHYTPEHRATRHWATGTVSLGLKIERHRDSHPVCAGACRQRREPGQCGDYHSRPQTEYHRRATCRHRTAQKMCKCREPAHYSRSSPDHQLYARGNRRLPPAPVLCCLHFPL